MSLFPTFCKPKTDAVKMKADINGSPAVANAINFFDRHLQCCSFKRFTKIFSS